MKPILAALACALALTTPTLHAADDPAPPVASAADPLDGARAHIAARRWPDAITELRRVGDTRGANWNNLMGYSLRKQSRPDVLGAERHYQEALRIDPKHRGALEYYGELQLMKGDVAAAESLLAKLSAVCTFGCEEFRDLKNAVVRYKAAGNRYSPTY